LRVGGFFFQRLGFAGHLGPCLIDLKNPTNSGLGSTNAGLASELAVLLFCGHPLHPNGIVGFRIGSNARIGFPLIGRAFRHGGVTDRSMCRRFTARYPRTRSHVFIVVISAAPRACGDTSPFRARSDTTYRGNVAISPPVVAAEARSAPLRLRLRLRSKFPLRFRSQSEFLEGLSPRPGTLLET
jgi:hypothetical protein